MGLVNGLVQNRMLQSQSSRWAMSLSVALHAVALGWILAVSAPVKPKVLPDDVDFVELVQAPKPPSPPPPPPLAAPRTVPFATAPAHSVPVPDISTAPPELLNRPYREAPPAPSAQEWATPNKAQWPACNRAWPKPSPWSAAPSAKSAAEPRQRHCVRERSEDEKQSIW
jgi:hypothetical protein